MDNLQREFFDFEAENRLRDESVSHLNRLQAKTKVIEEKEAPTDKAKKNRLLGGLGDEFSNIVGILEQGQDADFNTVVSSLKDEERRIKKNNRGTAMSVRGSVNGRGRGNLIWGTSEIM